MDANTSRIEVIRGPFRDFFQTEAAGGILMFIAAVIALVWANSPWSGVYFDLWNTTLSVDLGSYGMSMDLAHWINDGLMVIFFFVVGLEIKRELMVGELASMRQALLPIVAAFAGAVVPALIYVAINAGTDNLHGWGVPMATDIAFVIGILALLGSRVPTGLKIFITALAIVDDLIAVLVIAIFYTADISWEYLLAGLGVFALLLAANRAQIHWPLFYALFGIIMWFAFLQSGIHATISGVLLAITIPSRIRIDSREFLSTARAALDVMDRARANGKSLLTNTEHQSALQDLESATEEIQSPMQRLEHVLHPWVAFLIVPVFALANAGVAFGSDLVDMATSPVSLGIVLGLVVGKQIGITLSTLLMVRTGMTTLPDGVTMRHVYGGSVLAGIGFTMALFIAELAFLEPDQLAAAKVGILLASVIAAAIGTLILCGRRKVPDTVEQEELIAMESRRSRV